MKHWRQYWDLIKDAANDWMEDKAMRLGASLAYYTILSVAPLLVIVVGIAGLVFRHEDVQAGLKEQIAGLVGQAGGDIVDTVLKHSGGLGSSIPAIVIGVIVLLFGASSVFIELQDSLNTVWGVTPKPGRGLWTIIRERFLSFAMVLGTGFLLLVSLAISAALAGLAKVTGLIQIGVVGHVISFCVSFAVITLLFAMIFNILPDVEIRWGDVWVGALGTSLLFTAGKLLIGLYLGHASIGSTYGAAGSLVVFVVWVYYAALILFFGAEFTKDWANRFGSRIRPAPNAVPLTDEARAEQGIPRSEVVQALARQHQAGDRDGGGVKHPARPAGHDGQRG
jgi:membrane protein